MNTIETALLHGCQFLLDHRTTLKANLNDKEIVRMNETLRGLANALEQSIDSGWGEFGKEMTEQKGEYWAGVYQCNADYMKQRTAL